MNSIWKSAWIVMLLGMLVIVPIGCSSGGGGGGGGNTESTRLSGVAAAGAPIVGIVNAKGANGATASSPIDAAGHFDLDVSALTPNYILYAEGSVNGKSVRLYSAAVAAGAINITPITDLIVASAYEGLPSAAYDSWNGSQVSAPALAAAETQVQTDLQPLLTAAGVPAGADLMTTSFTANHTGLDQALDVLSVNYAGNTAVVTNIATGSTYSMDVTNPTVATGLPPSDATATVTAMTDQDAINLVWKKVETLWATSVPTSATVVSQIGPSVAADLLSGGTGSTRWLSDLSNDGPRVGIKVGVVITGPLTGTPYTKAYWVRVNYVMGAETGSFIDSAVFNGANWLIYGDRRWVQNDLKSHAEMDVMSNGTATFHTGFEFWMDDKTNYAFDRGVQSAVITGPGLPSAGVKMELVFPNTWFSLYQPGLQNTNNQYYITNDSVLAAIPDNSGYTVKFYAQTAAVVNPATDAVLHSFTEVIGKRPHLNSELNASVFPALSSPNSHDISAAHIPGSLTVTWTNPANTSMHNANLNFSDNTGNWGQVDTNFAAGNTTATIDTSTYSTITPVWASLWLSGDDQFGRRVSLSWQFVSSTGPGPGPTGNSISGMVTNLSTTTQGPILICVSTNTAFTNCIPQSTGVQVTPNFIVQNVPNGTYYVAAVQDVNGNLGPDPGEPWGAYGGATPTAVVVNNGSVSGINFTISAEAGPGPTGGYTISGIVTNQSSTTGQILICVSMDPSFTGCIPQSSGVQVTPNFTVQNVPNGTYYVGAVVDVNGNFIRDPGEPAGAFGGAIPTAVVVNSGNISGIDFNIQ